MSNVIQIKRGANPPRENTLLPYELGYTVNRFLQDNTLVENSGGGYLYIGELKQGDATKSLPVRIKAGYADTAGVANGLSADVINSIVGIKVTNATNADYANDFTDAAKKLIKGIKVSSASQADTATNITSNDSTKSFVTTTIGSELGIGLNNGKLAINKELQVDNALTLLMNGVIGREASIICVGTASTTDFSTVLEFNTTTKNNGEVSDYQFNFREGRLKTPKLCVESDSYGTTNPNTDGISGVEGQLYFQVVG